MKPNKLDYHLNWLKPYRKYRGSTWYKHQFTSDALEICPTFVGSWWAKYGKINRYSDVIKIEKWEKE